MNQELKHMRITTKTPRPDEPDTVDIDTKSYYEELNSVEQQIQKNIRTSAATLASDVMVCLREMTAGETSELELKITVNKKTGEPELIRKTWITSKHYYGKR